MKKALLILVLLLIPLSLFRLLFGLDLDEKSMKGVEERKQSQAVEDRDRQLISEFQAVAIPESFNGPEVWVPPIPTSVESQAVVPQTSSQDKSIVVADTQKEMEPSTSAVALVLKPLSTGNRIVLKMTVDNITLLQKALYKAGFYNGDYNGIFDERLLEILKDFQRYVDLEPDGIVDSAVIKYLDIYSSGCESAYALKISGGKAVEAVLYLIFIASNILQLFILRRLKKHIKTQREMVRLLLKGLYQLKYKAELVLSSA